MATLSDCLRPQHHVEPRDAADRSRYVRSYLLIRVVVGALGLVLPLVLVVVDAWAFDGPVPRDSLSAYYYSGLREVFVGGMAAVGVFLVSYKLAEVGRDNTLSTLAGVGALGVALLPKERDDMAITLTELQQRWGEEVVGRLHFASAVVFIGALAWLSFDFGVREGRRTDDTGRHPPQFWRRFHFAMGGSMLAGLAIAGISLEWDGLRWGVWLGETLAVGAFAVSWLGKGLELTALADASKDERPLETLVRWVAGLAAVATALVGGGLVIAGALGPGIASILAAAAVLVVLQRTAPARPTPRRPDPVTGRLVGINHVALEVGDVDEALEWYGRIFSFELRGRVGPHMAFIDLGDQFLAFSAPRGQACDDDRHFGLVVDDRGAVRTALQAAGADLAPGRGLLFVDPWGNTVEVVQYDEIQFSKTDGVLAGMQLGHLTKGEAARAELRDKGLGT